MKQQKLFIVVVLLLLSMTISPSANSQDGGLESRTYEIGQFSELFLEGAYGVELIQGKSPSLEVRASDSRAFDYLKINTQGELLHLHVDRKLFDFSRITLYITFETLNRLRIYGSVKLDTRGYLDLDKLDMLLDGGAKVKLQAKANQISLENRGGVLVELMGVTDVLNMRMTGAGHINAAELKARDVRFKIEGVGTGRVFATEKLNATINGAGKISYKGDPEVTQSIEGIGSISRD